MDSSRFEHCNMPNDRQCNVDRQLLDIMNVVDDALEFFHDIKLALDLGEDFQTIIALINPPLDPHKTIGTH
jgi:hypothetical protein